MTTVAPENGTISTPLRVKTITNKGLFCGYASVFNTIDVCGDCINPGAFKHSLKQWQNQDKRPKMLWQHSTYDPIGVWDYIEEDKKGLYVEGQLLLDVQRAREAYTLIKHGAIDGLSIGYRVVETNHDPLKQIRYLTAVELFEISVVTFAANLKARVTEVREQKLPM